VWMWLINNYQAIKKAGIAYSYLVYRWVRVPVVLLLVTVALLLTLFRAMTPWVSGYKGDIEAHLSALLGQTVTITHVKTSWYWFTPVLQLEHVASVDSEHHVLKCQQILIGIDLLSSLWHWQIQPGMLYLDGMDLTVHQQPGSLQIDGLSHHPSASTDANLYLPVLSYVLAQQKIMLKHVNLRMYLQDKSLLPIRDLNLVIVNHNSNYQAQVYATVLSSSPSKMQNSAAVTNHHVAGLAFKLVNKFLKHDGARMKNAANSLTLATTEVSAMVKIRIKDTNLASMKGDVYVALKHFSPMQWQGLMPRTSYRILAGDGDVELWTHLAKGHVDSVQTKFAFEPVIWSYPGSVKSHLLQAISANLAWKTTASGWVLTGDNITLRALGITWPQNDIKVDYNNTTATYNMYIKHILLAATAGIDFSGIQFLKPLSILEPIGTLQDLQVQITAGNLDYLLTSFAGLSWHGSKQLPAMQNVSGVLHWQPTGGDLALDSDNLIVLPKSLPPLALTKVTANVGWQALNNEWRVHASDMSIQGTDFLVTARGVLDEPFTPGSRRLQLNAEFSMHNVERWLPYIPSLSIQAKLRAWLAHDVKTIASMNGEVVINGLLDDFPFDTAPGDFSIKSHVRGVNLSFARDWPLNRDIDGYLYVNKRNFTADILHADMHGMLVDQVHLNIDGLGLGRETVFIHGQGTILAEKLQNYIFASPLRKRLAKLKFLKIDGPVGLDLAVEVPLYLEKDKILTRAQLTFDNNQVLFPRLPNKGTMNHVSGVLNIDKHGVINCMLSANYFDRPVDMRCQSKRAEKAYTEVNISGDTSIEILRNTLNLPDLPFVHGDLHIDSTLSFFENSNEATHLHVMSSLQSVVLDLPAPFGKSSGSVTPFTLDIDLDNRLNNILQLQFNYAERLSGLLSFAYNNQQEYKLQNGEIHIGSGRPTGKNKDGLAIIGTLATLDVAFWQTWLATYNSTERAVNFDDLVRYIDLHIGDLALWGTHYKNVDMKASQLAPNDWSIALKQPDISGTLRYQYTANSLTGKIDYLYLPNIFASNNIADVKKHDFEPEQLPNLALTIDEVKLGKVSVGQVKITGNSKEHSWILESATVNNPAYQLTMAGSWNKNGKVESTDLQGQLNILNLGISLQQWHMTPAVEARDAVVQFTIGWPRAIQNMAVPLLHGKLFLQLKKGRITHLDRETEEKLGLGKLLSILSLQTIPRRLTLDFSDLSKNGYSFDVFKGNFAIKNGVMTTNDSYMDGPVAYASMKGDLDVVKQNYDLELYVSPHITASLPVVATMIAGGPVVGVAAWVASKIIDKGMQKISGYSYKVTGPWMHPIVQQLKIYKAQQKAQ